MGVNELWKLFREEGLMQEWSVETDGPGAQKAVAEQIEGDWPKTTYVAEVLRPRKAMHCPVQAISLQKTVSR